MTHWTWRRFTHLIVFILIAQGVGIAGTYFTLDAIPTWYAALAKPSFAPPNWIFGPVWTTLYALMGIAAFFVWEERTHKTHAARGMNWYWGQLFLNCIWTPIFFGAQHIGLALIVIALLWLAIAKTLYEFGKVTWWAGALLIPYLAWVSFAMAVNYQLWMLN